MPNLRRLALICALALISAASLSSGCSSSNDGGGGTGGGSGGTGGGAGGTGGGGGGGASMVGAKYANCEGNFMDMTSATTVTIEFPKNGFNFSPKCITVKAGTMITWSGDFTAHPLTGATKNVTQEIPKPPETGTTVSATLMAPGFHGYFCAVHGTDSGTGMAGNIQITE